MADLLKKITISTIGFNKTKLQSIMHQSVADEKTGELVPVIPDGGEVSLARIVGVCSDIRPGQSDFGPFAKFIGEFQAKTRDGKEFMSGTAILPATLSDLIQGRVQQAKSQGQSIEFAAEVGAQKDATSATGYVFTARPLMEMKSSTRMAALLAAAGMGPKTDDPLLGNSNPALPTPSAAPAVQTSRRK